MPVPATLPLDPEDSARAAGLRYCLDVEDGIGRRRRGRGFSYHGPDGKPIRDAAVRARIQGLVIPPAWTDVWICPDARGHVQATGRDEAGRKQYVYHPKWREVRDAAKYARMIPFAEALPRLRRRVRKDLARDGLPRARVLAAVVRLLETTLIRVGNDEYARKNDSYGLTTLRDRHVVAGGRRAIRLEFVGKGGKPHEVEVDDPEIAELVLACRDLPGYELFQYHAEDGDRQRVGSGDVNAYIRDAAGDDFTAKDFRTWAGTVAAIRELLAIGPAASEREAARNVAEAVRRVSDRLRNTPAICRASYIHPEVLEVYGAGELEAAIARARKAAAGRPAGLRVEEAAALAFLRERLAS